MTDRKLRWHDLRGTAATRMYLAGLSMRTIAEILGWSEDSVGKIIRRYVRKDAAILETIAVMDRQAQQMKENKA